MGRQRDGSVTEAVVGGQWKCGGVDLGPSMVARCSGSPAGAGRGGPGCSV